MIKERIVPEHKEKYVVCDYCGREIDDYSHTSIESKKGAKAKHFHSMHAGGSKGTVKITCLEEHETREGSD